MFLNTFLSKDNVDNLATLSLCLLFGGYENKLAWINHLYVMEDNASRQGVDSLTKFIESTSVLQKM